VQIYHTRTKCTLSASSVSRALAFQRWYPGVGWRETAMCNRSGHASQIELGRMNDRVLVRRANVATLRSERKIFDREGWAATVRLPD
jgi:hypothetical protein